MAPKSLPHKITPPGLSALFPSRAALEPEPTPVTVSTPKPLEAVVSPVPVGEGSPPVIPAAPEAALPKPAIPAPSEAAAPAPAISIVRPAPVRKMSKTVRVTQPEVEGKPKGRHTLVIDETVLEELSLLAWAENMSVSAIAREAFDAYLSARKKAVGQARELRDSFGRKREAV